VIAAGLLLRHPGQPQYRQLTFRSGYLSAARFSPDGQTVVYSASWDGPPNKFYTSRVDGTDVRGLNLPPGRLLAVSPSGELAIAVQGTGWLEHRLARVPLSGGSPREVLDNVLDADWSPEGQLAVVRSSEGKCTLEFPIGHTLYQNIG